MAFAGVEVPSVLLSQVGSSKGSLIASSLTSLRVILFSGFLFFVSASFACCRANARYLRNIQGSVLDRPCCRSGRGGSKFTIPSRATSGLQNTDEVRRLPVDQRPL